MVHLVVILTVRLTLLIVFLNTDVFVVMGELMDEKLVMAQILQGLFAPALLIPQENLNAQMDAV